MVKLEDFDNIDGQKVCVLLLFLKSNYKLMQVDARKLTVHLTIPEHEAMDDWVNKKIKKRHDLNQPLCTGPGNNLPRKGHSRREQLPFSQ